ncbi:MAG: hypothetical protein HY369_01955 [Candidatus Aenigmarchaeota archaeon]|nr:hypothetical protein [Candidatus Aenigmarchaeota archaeon]
MRTGQVEIIIVAGIVVLAIIAILSTVFQTPPSPVPSSVAQAQKAVKESLLSAATASANDIIETMELHGGYLTDQILADQAFTIPEATLFLGVGVPYWQQCENDLAPTEAQVEGWLERGVELTIADSLGSLAVDEDVAFDTTQLVVDATIFDDKIDFQVALPTTVGGYAMPQPYTFTVPTGFGRVTRFARDFAAEASTTRFLENHALAALYFSEAAADGEPAVPTSGFLLECGKTIFRSPAFLATAVKEAIAHSLSSTAWWQPKSTDKGEPLSFAVPTVSGTAYPDLAPGLYFPDDFAFSFSSPVMIKNNEVDFALIPPFQVPNCEISYVQKYNLLFPVVVSVKDQVTGHRLNVASLVSIVDPGNDQSMEPGTCGAPVAAPGPCDDLACLATIKIVDSLGLPVQGASVSFGGCFAGESNDQGLVVADLLCGSGEVAVYKSAAYEFLTAATDAASLDGATLTLDQKPTVTLHFVQVGPTCAASPVDMEFVFATFAGDQDAAISNIDPAASQDVECTEANAADCLGNVTGILSSVDTTILPSGTYSAEVIVANPALVAANPGKLPTIVLSSTTVLVPPQDAELTVHVPDSDQLLQKALLCIGGPGDEPTGQCAPDFVACTTDCATLVNESVRSNWVVSTLAGGAYGQTFASLLTTCGLQAVEVA